VVASSLGGRHWVVDMDMDMDLDLAKFFARVK